MRRSSVNKIQKKIRELGKKQFLSLNIVDFAKKTEVSPATLSRYIRQQGFSSYRDYQHYLNNDSLTICKKSHLSNSIANFDKKLNEVFQDVINSKRVLTIGFGSSSHAPRELSIGLCQLGLFSAYFTQFQDLLPVFPSTKKSDLLIVFSECVRNRETAFILNQVKNHPLKCWLIGSYKKFPKVRNVIILESPEQEIVTTSHQHSIVNQNIFATSLLSYCVLELKLEHLKVKTQLLESEWNN